MKKLIQFLKPKTRAAAVIGGLLLASGFSYGQNGAADIDHS